jgi:hypothetical protein
MRGRVKGFLFALFFPRRQDAAGAPEVGVLFVVWTLLELYLWGLACTFVVCLGMAALITAAGAYALDGALRLPARWAEVCKALSRLSEEAVVGPALELLDWED